MSLFNIGRLIVVVGPSGAGKDSILKAAQTHFAQTPRVAFVRRIITRECDPASEVHDSVSEVQFHQMQRSGEFSVWWHANDLHYALPASVNAEIANGKLLVANGSRGAVDDIRSKFKQLTIVNISVAEEVLAARLERRSRESTQQIQARLQRNKTMAPLQGPDVVTINNSEARDTAINEFIALLDSYQ